HNSEEETSRGWLLDRRAEEANARGSLRPGFDEEFAEAPADFWPPAPRGVPGLGVFVCLQTSLQTRMMAVTSLDSIAFVKRHGIVLESARGPVPNLAEAVAGERIRGGWWGHPKGRDIFAATRAVRDSPDVLVCRFLDGKVTFIHRRLWPTV